MASQLTTVLKEKHFYRPEELIHNGLEQIQENFHLSDEYSCSSMNLVCVLAVVLQLKSN